MAIYDYLPKFNYIEPNNLKGLQPGFVVAQEERIDSSLLTNGMFENGKLCTISAAGIVPASEDSRVIFIHYSEPLNTIYNSDMFYAVNPKVECPRLVQLIPGDEWMSTDPDCAIEGRIIKVTTGEDWYAVDTMANGDKGYHYVFLG